MEYPLDHPERFWPAILGTAFYRVIKVVSGRRLHCHNMQIREDIRSIHEIGSHPSFPRRDKISPIQYFPYRNQKIILNSTLIYKRGSAGPESFSYVFWIFESG